METMAITDALGQIQSWYRQYYADSFFMAMAMASYLYLFAHKEKERKRFLYPIALIALCVLNPVLYALAYYQVIYWRLFWMLPDALLIAYAVTKLVKENRKMADKALVLAMALLLLITFGSNVYQKESFTKIQNPEKVDQAVKEVCDVMLGLEDSPKCILPAPLLSQARQYSGEIRSMYGRNTEGYILGADEEQMAVCAAMESEQPDFDFIFSRATELGYKFVVTYGEHVVEGDVVERSQYRELEPAGGYRIFYSGGERGVQG